MPRPEKGRGFLWWLQKNCLPFILMGEMMLRSKGDRSELVFKFDTSKFIDIDGDDSATVMKKMTAFHEKLRRDWAKFNKK